MSTALAFAPAARTATGHVRSHNEDAVFASPRIVAVADGVGGAAAGEVASAAALDEVILIDKCRLEGSVGSTLARAVSAGNERIGFIAECRPRYAGMATTLTAVAIEDDAYAVANIGDSRAYLLRDDELRRLTRDDSLVQQLVDDGSITPEQAIRHPQRSVVLASLDGDPARAPTLGSADARIGDRLLVCSDGLSDLVGDEEIAALLAVDSRERAAEALIDAALTAGGRDNVSVVVVDTVPLPPGATAWTR